MTAIQLRAELFRELNMIMSDESLMEKAIKSLRRINKKREPQTDSAAVDVNALPELPESILQLRGMTSHTAAEIAADDKLSYILSK